MGGAHLDAVSIESVASRETSRTQSEVPTPSQTAGKGGRLKLHAESVAGKAKMRTAADLFL
jgi:hypothetical protein